MITVPRVSFSCGASLADSPRPGWRLGHADGLPQVPATDLKGRPDRTYDIVIGAAYEPRLPLIKSRARVRRPEPNHVSDLEWAVRRPCHVCMLIVQTDDRVI